jgi:hypothetical protein
MYSFQDFTFNLRPLVCNRILKLETVFMEVVRISLRYFFF